MKSYIGKMPSWMDIKRMFTRLLPKWTNDCPFQIKGIAIKDAHNAFFKAKGRPKFRSRKAPKQSVYITKTAIKDTGIYIRVSGKGLCYRESLPETILDSRLVKQYDDWFLTVPYKTTTCIAENQGCIVALDPGVWSFQTFYSETSAGWLGYDDFGRIQRLCFHLDDLIGRTVKIKNAKKKRSMKKAHNRIRKKIKNLVSELHHKVASFLVKNFDVILLPTFESSQMVKKKNRKLRSKSVRAMLTFSHYKFKIHLKNKALEFGKTVIDVCEAFTSKTASWSGEIKNVGGSRVIRSGNIAMDRDLNGARGIFLRALGDSPTLMKMMGAC
jgi:putative transposase